MPVTSRGGMMAWLAARHSDRFGALVAESAYSDLPAEIVRRPELGEVLAELIPGYAKNRDAALRQRSVVNWADELAAGMPVLMLHGTADERVSPGSALRLAARLQALNRPYRLVMFKGGGHDLPGTHGEEVTREVIRWFERNLGPAADRRPGHERRCPAAR